MILLDTSALIEFLNHTGSTSDKAIESLIVSGAEVGLPDIALTEVLQGIKNDRDYREIKASLLTFPILTMKSSDSFIRAADLYRKCRSKGLTVRSTIDLYIAQIALENDALLLHNDRDFTAIASVCRLKLYH
jgi:predicted nucleic acid-binding protein